MEFCILRTAKKLIFLALIFNLVLVGSMVHVCIIKDFNALKVCDLRRVTDESLEEIKKLVLN